MRRLALLALLVLAGCGGGTSTTVSGNPLGAAADATAKQRSEKVAVEATIDFSGQTLTLNGSGAFERTLGELNVNFAFGPLGSSSIDEIFKGDVVWLSSPLLAGSLQGKHWVKLTLGKRSTLAGFDLNGLTGQTPLLALDKLRLNGTVSKLGQEKVDGVETTHYRLQVASGDYKMVEAWVDGQTLVRKLMLDYNVHVDPTSNQQAHTVLTMRLSDFGTAVSVKPPPAADVADSSQVTG